MEYNTGRDQLIIPEYGRHVQKMVQHATGIKDEKDNLHIKINKRVDEMIKKGLIEEAQKLYVYRNKNSMQTIGYKEAFMYLDGEIDKQKCIEMIKRNTRRYSKRQMTWFNKMENIKWFYNTEEKIICDYLFNQIN